MIQEKDFLYRVPVKTALTTTPRGQIRNPEILVDLEGGEFMHGNILDANSTNKLINQSVKDAVDNKLIERYVTKDLFNAETDARTKGDKDLSSKIQAEQTRAEGKEKDISDKLAIVDGDSNTEGSFRKAIATKADATALSNYVLTTALNQQVDTLNAAISAKQDAGNYIPYENVNEDRYKILRGIYVEGSSSSLNSFMSKDGLYVSKYTDSRIYSNIQGAKIELQGDENRVRINDDGIDVWKRDDFSELGISDYMFGLSKSGVTLHGGDDNHVLTSNASTIDITQYALKTELPTVPTKTSELTNDSNFIAANFVTDHTYDLGSTTLRFHGLTIDETGIYIEGGFNLNEDGITFDGALSTEIPTASGSFINIDDYVRKSVYDENIALFEARISALEAKHQEAAA